MKTKQLKTIGLLIVVIAIWGYLIYKVIVSLNPEEPSGVIRNQLPNYKKSTVQVTQEDFDVYIPTRDPFLNIVLKTPETRPKTVITPKRKKELNLDSLWSGIVYKGRIGKPESKQFLYLISFRNNEVILKPNESYTDFKLTSAGKEQISLRYKNYKKTISVSTP